jgi:hypothetical protein
LKRVVGFGIMASVVWDAGREVLGTAGVSFLAAHDFCNEVHFLDELL